MQFALAAFSGLLVFGILFGLSVGKFVEGMEKAGEEIWFHGDR